MLNRALQFTNGQFTNLPRNGATVAHGGCVFEVLRSFSPFGKGTAFDRFFLVSVTRSGDPDARWTQQDL